MSGVRSLRERVGSLEASEAGLRSIVASLAALGADGVGREKELLEGMRLAFQELVDADRRLTRLEVVVEAMCSASGESG